MTDSNLYRPPSADVADQSPEPTPQTVVLACRLVIGTLIVGAVTLIPGVRPVPPDEPEAALWAIGLVLLVFGGLTLFLVSKVHSGRNWARWALLGYLALGWLLVLSTINEDVQLAPMAATADMACVVAEVVACLFLFGKKATTWFARVKQLANGVGGA